MANVFQNESLISKVVLEEFKNNLVLAKTVNRQFQDTFTNNSGTTVNIRKPTRYTTSSGADATGQVQDIIQRTVPLTIDRREKVVTSVTSEQLALNLDDFNREVIQPSMLQLANKVDVDLYTLGLQVYNNVGTAGTAPNTFGVINDARTKLDSFGVRTSPRYACLNVLDGGALASGLQGQFNYSDFNREILKEGYIGEMAGFGMHQVQNTVESVLTDEPTGDIGSPVVGVDTPSGQTFISMTGFTAGITIFAGAVLTVAGVGAVNPITRTKTGQLAQFVVTADTVVDGGGAADIPVSPAPVLAGTPYDNVTALPLAGAPVIFEASHTINLAYHPEAFTLAMIKLWEPNDSGAYAKTMVDSDAGISVRMTKQYDNITDVTSLRFDILYGIQVFPEYATRILGSYAPGL
jgi:hypothetical protein